MSYDPQSTDAMFSRILERMDQQDHVLQRIEQQVLRTNGRVSELERWRDIVTAKTAGIAAAVGVVVAGAAWLLERVIK